MDLFKLQTIPLLAPADYQAGAQDLDSINMGRLHAVRIIIQMGAITGNDPVIKVYTGATAGTKTTEMAFKYRLSTVDSPAASADVFGARTAIAAGGTGLTFADSGDYNLRTLEIDVMADQMPDGHDWLTVETDDGSASALFLSAVAIGAPRYAQDTALTAL
ncbi:MAG: hypothetical protein AB7I50_00570 [Vicinamibacterales bacterium]